MSRSWLTVGSLFLMALLPLLIGCGPKANPQDGKDDHHGHDHHHGAGGVETHVLEIGDPEDHHLEWSHDDKAHKVAFVVKAKDQKTEVPVAMEKLVVMVTVEGKEPVSYDVPAENLKDGKASKFSVVKEELVESLALEKGVVSNVKIKIGDKEHEVKVDHGHEEEKK